VSKRKKESTDSGAAKIALVPEFSFKVGGPSLATIYMSHYSRLCAVLAAARSGDRLLIKLAVDHADALGCKDEPQ